MIRNTGSMKLEQAEQEVVARRRELVPVDTHVAQQRFVGLGEAALATTGGVVLVTVGQVLAGDLSGAGVDVGGLDVAVVRPAAMNSV